MKFKELGERFHKYMKAKGLKNKDVAKTFNFSGSQVTNIIHGRVFGSDKLFLILNVYKDLNPEWLLTGAGEMLKGKSLEVQEDSQYESKSLDDKLNMILDKISVMENIEKRIESVYGYVYGSISLNKEYFEIICDHIGVDLHDDDESNNTKHTDIKKDL